MDAKDMITGFPAWLRIEPSSRLDDSERGVEARTADPLWMLARQWQMGEFRGEDAGSALTLRVDYATHQPKQWQAGGDWQPLGSDEEPGLQGIPLETQVEGEKSAIDWRNRVRAGREFERLIGTGKTKELKERFKLRLPAETELRTLDYATQQFLQFMAGKVLDGKRILEQLDDLTGIEPKVMDSFKEWCAQLGISLDPKKPITWRDPQLDYRFGLGDEQVSSEPYLIAPEYRNGDLDWYAFNVTQALGKDVDWHPQAAITGTPAHFRIRGTSLRWWEFEDARTHFGDLAIDKPDLAKLALMEYVLAYGDDWYQLPLPFEIPNLVRIDNITITNVFGEQFDGFPPAQILTGDNPLQHWEVFTLATTGDPARPGLGQAKMKGLECNGDGIRKSVLFLPPVLKSREEHTLEEVLFLRDEGANMVWGIEHTVLNHMGAPVRGFDAQREAAKRKREAYRMALENQLKSIDRRLQRPRLSETAAAALRQQQQLVLQQLEILERDEEVSAADVPHYRLASSVPENWIPYLPVDASTDPDFPAIRLVRAVLERDDAISGSTSLAALTNILGATGEELKILEEASVPRAGQRVLLSAQRARWSNGKTFVWRGRKVLTGSGENGSGLRFDVIGK